MKTKSRITFSIWLALLSSASLAEPLPTAFTYQGRLQDGSSPANGLYELRLTVHDAATDGTTVGGPLANVVSVTNGHFATTLDFGSGVFAGGARWLEIAVRTNGGGTFTTLSPRQLLTPTPYALYAPSAGAAAAATSAASVMASGVATASLQTNAVTTEKIADGTIAAADLSPSLLSNTFWRLGGNAGTTPGVYFLGTTDNQPLELKAGNQRALRLEPADYYGQFLPNIIAGAPDNTVVAGVAGATIGGGGDLGGHRIAGSFSTIAGGRHHLVEGYGSTIGGGQANSISSNCAYSTIAGGWFISIDSHASDVAIGGGSHHWVQTNADYATIAGGLHNLVGTNTLYSAIGGGRENQIQAEAHYSVIAGGASNVVMPHAQAAFIAGGQSNLAAASFSHAAGHRAKANHTGAFVWADSTDADFGSSANNQFLIRAAGGVGIGTTNPQAALDVAGTLHASGLAVESSTLVSNLNAGQLEGHRASDFWRLGGNTVGASNAILGTLDSRTLDLRAGGTSVLRLVPNSNGPPNIVAGSISNVLTGPVVGATISGGEGNTIAARAHRATVAGGAWNDIGTNSYASAIGGGYDNNIGTNSYASAIGGGYLNNIAAGAPYATIAGGFFNDIGINSLASTIAGGYDNTIPDTSLYATIAGGAYHDIGTNSEASAIGGGFDNHIAANAGSATIAGGRLNDIGMASAYSAIAGGYENNIAANAPYASIAGGRLNDIGTNSYQSAIAGGYENNIEANANNAAIGGGTLNVIRSSGLGSVIAGGWGNTIQSNAQYTAVGGGYNNTNGPNARYSFIGGGIRNTVQSDGQYAFIGGGANNTVGTNSSYAVIGGGTYNRIEKDLASSGVIGGGAYNRIESGTPYASILGGHNNTIQYGAESSALAGGYYNTIQTNAAYATIGGGSQNMIRRGSTAASIGGGYLNTVQSDAQYATIPGGYSNTATNYAFAAGRRAKAYHTGSFVWADSVNADFASSSNNQFLVRAGGGMGIGTNNPQAALHVVGTVIADAFSGPVLGLANVAYLDADQTFTGGNSFLAPLHLSDVDCYLRAGADENHGIGWYGSVKPFAGIYPDGPVVYGWAGGALGTRGGGDKVALYWNSSPQVCIGTTTPAQTLTVAGGAQFERNNGRLVLRTPTRNEAGRFGIQFSNNVLGLFLGDDSQEQRFSFYTAFSPFRTNDASLWIYGKTTNGWGTCLQLTHNGTNGLIATDVGHLVLSPAQNVGIKRTPINYALEVEGNASKTTAGSWLANSDRRIKTDVAGVSNALETLARVRLVGFRYTDEYRAQHPSIEDRRYLNVVAQEFAEVFPEYVKGSGERLAGSGEEILQVDSYPLTIYAAAAVQELADVVKRKDAELQSLKEKVGALERLVTRLAQEHAGAGHRTEDVVR